MAADGERRTVREWDMRSWLGVVGGVLSVKTATQHTHNLVEDWYQNDWPSNNKWYLYGRWLVWVFEERGWCEWVRHESDHRWSPHTTTNYHSSGVRNNIHKYTSYTSSKPWFVNVNYGQNCDEQYSFIYYIKASKYIKFLNWFQFQAILPCQAYMHTCICIMHRQITLKPPSRW